MIQYLLDTDICIYLIKERPGKVIRRLRQESPTDVGVSSITLSELELGVHRSARPEQNRTALFQFLAPLSILPYDDLAAACYGELRSHLESSGTPIGSMDTLIAAHALSLECKLVTNNVREFSRATELAIENWA